MRLANKWPVAVLLAAAVTGTLFAQPATSGAAAADKIAATDEARKLDAKSMRASVGLMAEQVTTDARQVWHLRELARKQQDVIKLTCVNDQFVQTKAQLNLFDRLRAELEPLLADDRPERFDAYEKVAESARAIRDLREQASACIGEPELSDNTDNDFNGPDILDDPTQQGEDSFPGLGVEPPGYASPFR